MNRARARARARRSTLEKGNDMSPSRGHFINNSWITGTGNPLQSRNPANEEIIWQGHHATQDEVQSAVTAAYEAKNEWSLRPFQEKIKIIESFKDIVNKRQDQLSEAISKETGKPLWDSRAEVSAMLSKVDLSIEAYNERCSQVVKEHPAGKSVTRRKPHGVIAIFGPFNFPAHLPNGHIIPALLAGNTIVFKPSEMTPTVGEILMECWEECHLPPGVLNMVQGGRETGRLLAGNTLINGVFFTGSWETGVLLSEQFAKHTDKILALEMGGNNPLVVSQINDPKAAALITIQSAFVSSGQRCTCARRLIVVKNSKNEEFISTLSNMIGKIKVGTYQETPEPFMGPVISEKVAQYLLTVQDTLKLKGGQAINEMHLLKVNSALISPGLMDVTHVAPVDQEIFGPFLQLIWVDDFNAAITAANNTAFGLTAGLLSTSEEEYNTFFNSIHAGVINWNTPLTGASSAAPFGGIGRSGNHRPSGYYTVDYCSVPVASLESNQINLPKTLPPGLDIS